jgi:hypothetical protein
VTQLETRSRSDVDTVRYVTMSLLLSNTARVSLATEWNAMSNRQGAWCRMLGAGELRQHLRLVDLRIRIGFRLKQTTAPIARKSMDNRYQYNSS